MGEHNAEALGEAGFTAAEIAGLAEAGVIAARTETLPSPPRPPPAGGRGQIQWGSDGDRTE